MRLVTVLIVCGAAAALPHFVGQRLLAHGDPRTLIRFSLLSLTGLSAGFVALLWTVVDPFGTPTALPGIVDRCLGAVTVLLDHPFRHWPGIVAAVLLVGAMGRLAYVAIVTLRRSRRRTLSLLGLAERPHAAGGHPLVMIPAAQPVALAVGVLRRQVLISAGAWALLDARERTAVIAHEQAHVRGWHAALMLLGRVAALAFPFIPPIRRGAEQLLLGLEMVADDAAVRRVGEPLVVARALEKMAQACAGMESAAPAAAEGEVLRRVRRLLSHDAPRRSGRMVSMVAAPLALSVILALAAALPQSGFASSAAQQARATHNVCHLPHPDLVDVR